MIYDDLGPLTQADLDQINNPDWEKAVKTHDWRNHVPVYFKEHWHLLSEETRVAIFAMARIQANAEEWE